MGNDDTVVGQVAATGSVALAATWFGAWLNARQSAKTEGRCDEAERKRRDVEVRAAARLVLVDLGMTAVQAAHAARSRSLMSLRAAPTAAWGRHGVLLVAELPADVHEVVAQAMARAAAVQQLVVGADLGLTGIDTEAGAVFSSARELAQLCRHAQRALAPIAYPGEEWHVPTVSNPTDAD